MSGTTTSGFSIGRSTGRCAATGEALEPGAPAVACLVERETDDGLDRLDYTLSAWESGVRPEGLVAFWRRTVPHPDEKPRLLVDDEELLSLFDQLAGEEARARQVFRYLLALILLRKRLLRPAGRRGDEDGPVLLVRPRGADAASPPVEVVEPALDEAAIEQATEQLSQALRGDA